MIKPLAKTTSVCLALLMGCLAASGVTPNKKCYVHHDTTKPNKSDCTIEEISTPTGTQSRCKGKCTRDRFLNDRVCYWCRPCRDILPCSCNCQVNETLVALAIAEEAACSGSWWLYSPRSGAACDCEGWAPVSGATPRLVTCPQLVGELNTACSTNDWP